MLNTMNIQLSGEQVQVRQLMLEDLELVWPLLDQMNQIPTPSEETSIDDRRMQSNLRQKLILEIFAIPIGISLQELRSRMTFPESKLIVGKFNELMVISGLIEGDAPLAQTKEVAATNDGTLTTQ